MTKERKKQREEVIKLLSSKNKEDRLLGLEFKSRLNFKFSKKEWAFCCKKAKVTNYVLIYDYEKNNKKKL